MKMPICLALLAALALGFTERTSAQGAPAAAATPCKDVTGLEVICGQEAPEDLVVLPGGRWVVASSMAGNGGLNIISVNGKATTRLYPAATAKHQLDSRAFPGCPGPPDAAAAGSFTTHGLWLQPAGPVARVLAVAHGRRESIEVFDVDVRGAAPAVTWVGCVVAPDPIGLNSVRGLPDGGFIASNFLPRGVSPAERQKLFAGEKNGELWEWHAASGWQKVPGSELSGANGLELSDDGRWIYVSAWGSQSFVRLSRGSTPVARSEVPLGFRVDNIRRSRDGSLLAVGQGAQATEIVRIDPEKMTVTKVASRVDDPAFRSGTVAIEADGRLWVGSFTGDRIAVLPGR
jgi:DNA-binding beta-propeller fold protein YncE